jgi:nucleoside-diphosphate-sugar epimerase
MVEFTRLIVKYLGKRTPVFRLSPIGVSILDTCVALLDMVHINPGVRRPSQMNVDKPCSFQKIRAELGWEPRLTLEQSIADSVDWSARD